MIKTTKTTYCPKKLITNNYLLTIRRTSKKDIYLSSKNVSIKNLLRFFLKIVHGIGFLKILGKTSSHLEHPVTSRVQSHPETSSHSETSRDIQSHPETSSHLELVIIITFKHSTTFWTFTTELIHHIN